MFNSELPTVWLKIDQIDRLERYWYCKATPASRRHHVWIRPGTLKAEFVFWAQENLTDPERVAIRLAWGECGDLRIPVRDSVLDGELTADSIPVDLRLPSERLVAQSA
jgi:hypothetical protein